MQKYNLSSRSCEVDFKNRFNEVELGGRIWIKDILGSRFQKVEFGE